MHDKLHVYVFEITSTCIGFPIESTCLTTRGTVDITRISTLSRQITPTYQAVSVRLDPYILKVILGNGE